MCAVMSIDGVIFSVSEIRQCPIERMNTCANRRLPDLRRLAADALAESTSR
jgi:hypothetical protein